MAGKIKLETGKLIKSIPLTGEAGFIGSHTYLALVTAGYDVTILDNFENSKRDVPDRLAQVTGAPVAVIEADTRDADHMDAALARGFDAVAHFADLPPPNLVPVMARVANGDMAELLVFGDVSRAQALLGFETEHNLQAMCASNWALSDKTN